MRSAESVRAPIGALHRVSRTPRTKTNTRVFAGMLHSPDAGQVVSATGTE